MVKDHMRGDYRGRKFDFSYKFLCQTSFESRGQSWHTQIQIMTHSPPDGRFKLDQKRFFKKAGPPIGDRYFDKHTKIVKEKPRGYVGEFFSDPVLRKRVAKFFVYPSMEDRTISLTPTGRLKLDDSGLFLSRKRLLKNLDLLTDLAEIVENPEHDET